MCTDAKKRKKEREEKMRTERREDRGRNWEGKRRVGGRRNEILANAFVFAMWLHRDVTMEVIGIPWMSQCNNSICVHAVAYTYVVTRVSNSGIQVTRSAMLCRVFFAV